MGGYKRIGRELIHKGAIVELYKDKMQLDDGSVHDWDFIKHPGAAAVVPVDKDGNITVSTMFVDAVQMKVSRSSTSAMDKRYSFTGNEDVRELLAKSCEGY